MHPSIVLTIGSAIMLLGIAIASFAETWPMYVFAAAVIYPFGIAYVYYTPILCGWEWFPNNKGLISGLILGGFGFGAFFFGFISTALTNPDDI